MHTIAQDLAESLDVFSTNMKSIQLETIAQNISILDTFRKNLLNQVRSGYVPCTDTEVAEIEDFSEDSHLLLESLTGALAQTSHIFQTLKEVKKTANAAFVCAQTLLFSPIRRLPPEILTEVFHEYIFSKSDYALRIENEASDERMDMDTDTEYTESDYEEDVEPEFGRVIRHENTACPSLRLGWICSHWRNLTLSEPRFWSSIYININFHPRGSFLKLCQNFLSHSGQGPLVLHITTRNHDSSHLGVLGHLLNFLLREHSTRWDHVTLGVSTSWYAHATRWGQVAFPNLKHLDVANTYRDTAPFRIGQRSSLTSDLFTSCPKLETYVGESLDWSTFKLHDFSHLTTLSLEMLYYVVHIAPFLSLLPALKTLSLCMVIYPSESQDPPEETIGDFSHGKLTDLRLTTDINTELWRGIRLPKLTTYELTFSSYENLPAGYLSEMSSLFHRSGCILKDVTLNHLRDTPEIVSFIGQHPSIIFLTIRTYGFHYPVLLLDQLISSSKATSIVPKLQSLTIVPGDLRVLAGSMSWFGKLAEFVEWKAARAAEGITMDSASDLHTVVRLKEFRLDINPLSEVCEANEDSEERTHLDRKSRPNQRARQWIEEIKNRVEALDVGFTLRWGSYYLYQACVD